jgi:hypothetical protein
VTVHAREDEMATPGVKDNLERLRWSAQSKRSEVGIAFAGQVSRLLLALNNHCKHLVWNTLAADRWLRRISGNLQRVSKP